MLELSIRECLRKSVNKRPLGTISERDLYTRSLYSIRGLLAKSQQKIVWQDPVYNV